MELWVRDVLRVAIFAFSKKRSRTCCFFGPARVQEVSRESRGHRQGQGRGTSDTELSTAPGMSRARMVRRGCPRAGVSLTAPTTLRLPWGHSSCQAVVPVPQCHTRAGAASGRLKAVPGWICPTVRAAPSLHQCLYPKLLSAHPHSWLRDKPGITPSLISKEPRPGQTWLFWLRKDTGTCPSLTQHSHPEHSTALGGPRSRGRAQQGAQGSDPCGFCPFLLQQQRPTGSHTPSAPQWGPSSSHSLQV